MTKAKKLSRPKTQQSSSFFATFQLDKILPEKFHLPTIILVTILLFIIFFKPMFFDNKTFQSGDIIASKSMVPYVQKDRDGFSLWNPHLFCGMPAYAVGMDYTWFNLIYVGLSVVKKAYQIICKVDYAVWSLYLIILAVTSFLLMKQLTKNTLVSLFTSLTTSFSTGIIVLLYIGHVTKLTSLCMYPLLFLIILKFQEKIKLIYFLILVITLQLFIQGFHVQIIFYTLFAVAIYYIFFFVKAILNKNSQLRMQLIKSAGAFILATVIAVLISADNLTQIYEYTPYSTRGAKNILEEKTGKVEQSESDYYDYHTNWSFSPGEVMTFVIPSFYGFGNSVYKGSLTQDQEVEVNTYFGQMPFVDVAMYMGAVVLFFALFGIISCWKDPFVKFLSLLSLIALIISFGKNFSLLFDLMFYYFPYFDKFRVPSMILVLVQLSLPILAGFGLMKIISLREVKDLKSIKLLKLFAYIFTGLFVVSILMNQPLSNWFASRVNEYASSIEAQRQNLAQQLRALSEYMSEMFINDFMFAFGLSAFAFWCAVFYINQKLSRDIFISAVIIFSLIDLWRIDARGAKYIENPNVQGMFDSPDYVKIIKEQNDKEPFRILNLKQDGSLGSFNQNSNYNAYFLLEDFYGYSGIKPRSYQDLIDVVGPVNPTLWRMLNVKYLIFDKQQGYPNLALISSGANSSVFRNDNAMSRFYFINKVETKPNLEVLNMIKENKFDPKEIAFIHEGKLNIDKPDSTASIKTIKYTDEKINLEVNASGNNFIFFGNTYLPSGWNAYIDEQKTEIHRTNHGFMGIAISKGKHTVVFEYLPTSWVISKWIVLILSGMVLIVLSTILIREKFHKSIS